MEPPLMNSFLSKLVQVLTCAKTPQILQGSILVNILQLMKPWTLGNTGPAAVARELLSLTWRLTLESPRWEHLKVCVNLK